MSFDKRYVVISAPSPSGPVYRIYDRLNECSIEGGFDTQRWAEAVAEMMEEKYKRMTTLEILNSTPKDRQLWYWRTEMESCHRRMRIYPKGDERRKHWYERYVSAIRTYNELSGMNLKPQEVDE